jgi:hypothetical protein
MLPQAPILPAVEAYEPSEEFNRHYHHLEELLQARVQKLQQQQQLQQEQQQQQQQLQTLSADVIKLRDQLRQQQQQHQEQQLLLHAALAQAMTMKRAPAMTDTAVVSTAAGSSGTTASTNSVTSSSSNNFSSESQLQPLALQQLDTASSGNCFHTVTSPSIGAAACSAAGGTATMVHNAPDNMTNADLTSQHTAAITQQANDKQAPVSSQQLLTDLVNVARNVSTDSHSIQCSVTAATSVGTLADRTSTVAGATQLQDYNNIDSADQTSGVRRAVCDDTLMSDSNL